jgi:RNA polymerase primary sigma factor
VKPVNTFRHDSLMQLTDQQVRFAPPSVRLEQLRNAEKLLGEVDLLKEYPYQFVCYRITDFRSDANAAELMMGRDLVHDLGMFIREVARSMPAMPIEELNEPVLTLEEFSRKLNVTTKTVNRWRKRGLIGLPVIYKGRRLVGFLPSLTDPFLAANREHVSRSGRFSQMTEQEKEDILQRARNLVRQGVASLTEISRRVAHDIGRATETVRYTLRNWDREHPDQPLFPSVTGTIDPATKQMIFNSFRRGITVHNLAKSLQRTASSMYRVIHEIRAQRFLDQKLEFMDNPTFADPSNDAAFLANMPGMAEFDQARRSMRIPKDAPPELTSLYQMPLLTKEQEQHLFRKFNYLKFKAAQLLKAMLLPNGRLDCQAVRSHDLDQIDKLLKEATAVKDLLISCNMRLVVSIAKKHSAQSDNFFELLSDGNVSLIRAVEKFDYARGNKFSTYASWAIMKNFARSLPDEKTRRERFQTGKEEIFDLAPDHRTDEFECLAVVEQASYKVNRLLDYLEPREREIIRMRAGLEDGAAAMTLAKIGEKLGITKERVRQLNVRAMKKLRSLAETQKDEV